ncbi:tyrosine-type recombinase/integrase [Sphingopyxis sp. A083]|jgi:hypothetical protein|uniref:tyrosine-type recombinase/integrase n=1 Tax=Sphingopyxis sp. A083 TaxID=1759083 RepID=UPI000736708F|nr:integrase family protein [Sphingopyxis sp. A083]KTE77642.1 hypothetical protein ATE59_05545 [Sphingopyxis sp. A083]
MPSLKITKRAVDALPATGSQTFVWDTEVKGFGLKVTPAGKRTYVFQYRTGGRETATQRVTIGEHGSPWSPDAARKEALRLSGLVRQGGDPREDARQRRKAAVTLAFSDYADFFVDRYLKPKWKTWREAERILNRDVKPMFRRRPLPSISKGDIDDLLSGMDDRPALKRQAYAILKKLFNWAVKTRGDIVASPMDSMEAVSTVPSRARHLAAEELAAFVLAVDQTPFPFGPYFRMLAGTLQRRATVAGAEWSQFSRNRELWSIPAQLMKNGLDHVGPCNSDVRETLESLGPKRAGLIFTTTGSTGISGFSKAKSALDRRMTKILRARAEQRGEDVADIHDSVLLPPWRFHDLRRTGVTALQAMGVPVEVTEDILAHTSGTREGVAGVYNKYRYLPEKRIALELWGEFLRDLRSTTLAAEPHRKWLYADRLKRLDADAT